MSKIVTVAIDPGDDTGWAWAEVQEEELMSGGVKGALGPRSSCIWDVGTWEWRRDGAGLSRVRWENRVASFVVDLCRTVVVDSGMDRVEDTFVLVIENFTLRLLDQGPSLLSPVRITSKIEYALAVSGLHIFTGSSPSDAMNIVTNERLLRWGLLPEGSVSGSLRHGIDAERHLVLHLRKYASDQRYRALFPPGRKFVSNLA